MNEVKTMREAIEILEREVDNLESNLSAIKQNKDITDFLKSRKESSITNTICNLNHAIKVLEEYRS